MPVAPTVNRMKQAHGTLTSFQPDCKAPRKRPYRITYIL